jgi:2-oxoisovalerate ferredoxin oxidoreductase beta subunit
MRVCELLATLDAPVYLERCSLEDSKSIMKTRKAIRRAIQNQVENRGFSLVEVLSPCPTGWKLDPIDSRKWITEKMLAVFPLGIYKERPDAAPRPVVPHAVLSNDDVLKAIGVSRDEKRSKREIDAGFPTHELVIAGFGGQGVLLLGQLLAKSSMSEGKFVSWLPSYGPEMRGGTANCHVVVSGRRIGTPYVSNPSLLVAMNQPSLEKFAPLVKPGGLVVYDSSFVKDVQIPGHVAAIPIPFSEIANGIGDARVANMVAVGAVIELTGITETESIQKLIHALPKKALVDANLAALKAGREAAFAQKPAAGALI